MLTPQQLQIASLIDHALLAPNLTTAQLESGCREAASLRVASVCILPHAVRLCSQVLAGSGVLTSTVIGFPHGANTIETKVAEARDALDDGAVELDMVCNISRAVSNDWDYLEREIAAVLVATHGRGAKLKIIFETCYLNDAQKIELCKICSRLKVDWVKTSTGFGTAGATEHDIRLMREHTDSAVGVKASGGIRDLAAVRLFQSLGCSRIGASRTAAILAEVTGTANNVPTTGY